MKRILLVLSLVMAGICANAQAIYDLEVLPMCWTIGEVDSTLYAYWQLSSRDDEPKVLSYLNAEGTKITVSGGTLRPGYCGQVTAGMLLVDVEVQEDSIIVLYNGEGGEIGRDTVGPFRINVLASNGLNDHDLSEAVDIELGGVLERATVVDGDASTYPMSFYNVQAFRVSSHTGSDSSLVYVLPNDIVFQARQGNDLQRMDIGTASGNPGRINITNISDDRAATILTDRPGQISMGTSDASDDHNVGFIASLEDGTAKIKLQTDNAGTDLVDPGMTPISRDSTGWVEFGWPHLAGDPDGISLFLDTLNNRIVVGQNGATYDLPYRDPDAAGLPPGEYLVTVNELGGRGGDEGYTSVSGLVEGIEAKIPNSVFRSNLQVLKDSTNYTPGGNVYLTESGTKYDVKYALSELESEDDYFAIKLNEPTSTAENLICWSENLEVGALDTPIPGRWEYYGAGSPDLTIYPDAVDGPAELGGKADMIVKENASLFKARLKDTIFAGEQYYLSFWLRCSATTPTTSVRLNAARFRDETLNTTTSGINIPLITTDTTWRRYEVALAVSASDIPVASFESSYLFLNATDTLYSTAWSITRESDYTYYKTGENSVQKGVLWATLDTDKGVVDFGKLPKEIGTPRTQTERLQAVNDYCFETGNCSDIFIPVNGLTVTDRVTLNDGIHIVGNHNGRANKDEGLTDIWIDIDDYDKDAFFAIPDTANSSVEAVGVGFRNLRITALSPVNHIVNLANTLGGVVENVYMFGDSMANTAVRIAGEFYEDYPDGDLYGIGNRIDRSRFFNFNRECVLIEGGTLNYIVESQLHRSTVGLRVGLGASVTCHDTQIEKSSGLAIDVVDCNKFVFDGGYFEGQNRLSLDTVGMRFHNINNLIFTENAVSNAGIEVDAFIELDSVLNYTITDNRFSGPNGARDIDYTPLLTKKVDLNNEYFATGFLPVQNTLPAVHLVDPSMESAFVDTAFLSSVELRDTTVLSNFVLRGKTNHVAESEAFMNGNGTYLINPTRLTVVQNDDNSPIDGELTSEKITLTADVSAKLITITPTDLSFEVGKTYNLSYYIRPGDESFNDNLTNTFNADKNVLFVSNFDATVKAYQKVEVTIRPTIAAATVSIQFLGDASDYFWINNMQLTEGSYLADYSKTTGTTTAKTPTIGGDIDFTENITAANLPTFLNTTSTLDFPSTAANAISDLTMTVTGAIEGGRVIVAPPVAATAQGDYAGSFVSAANTVTIRFHNDGAGTYDPPSGDFTVTVIQN